MLCNFKFEVLCCFRKTEEKRIMEKQKKGEREKREDENINSTIDGKMKKSFCICAAAFFR